MNTSNSEHNQIHKATPNLIDERIQSLKILMPDLFDGDGNLDETALRDLTLKYNGDKVEKFEFKWAGKQASKRVGFEPSRATLTANIETSKDFDTTKNLLIEGDNLEVLKLLQKSYHSKVKCIYIDPPYNTGKDFIYPDNYGQTRSDYWQDSGAVDSVGIKLESNPDSSGKYHSNWLNMMQPRLLLARNLMREDGVIFVSIDDHEVHNLRKLMDEVFGEENFMTIMIWAKSGTTAGHFANAHEYVMVFAKDKLQVPFFEFNVDGIVNDRAIKKLSKSNPASIIKFPAGFRFEGENAEFSGTIGGSETQRIVDGKMVFENGKLKYDIEIEAGWGMRNQILSWLEGEETFDTKGQRVTDFYFNSKGILWYEKERGTIHPKTVFDKTLVGTTRSGTEALDSLMEIKGLLEFPKSPELIKYLIGFNTNSNDIILDFFAGSGTTGQAVMEINAEDGGSRQFILVQIPEKTGEKSEAYKAGYKTIFEICAERVRRAGDKIMTKPENKDKKVDIGFRVLTLGCSNFPENTFDADPDKSEEENLQALEEYITAETNSLQLGNDTTSELLLEIAFKQGFDLGYTVDKVDNFKSNIVYLVRDETQKMLICLDEIITKETVEEMKNHLEINFVCTKSGLDTTNKWNLERTITKDRLFVF
jgi:adenine-specific DNA-methyltransferase